MRLAEFCSLVSVLVVLVHGVAAARNMRVPMPVCQAWDHACLNIASSACMWCVRVSASRHARGTTRMLSAWGLACLLIAARVVCALREVHVPMHMFLACGLACFNTARAWYSC
jgi:hypothetical protein